MIHRWRGHLADTEPVIELDHAFNHDLRLRRDIQLYCLARHHLDVAVHNGADHFHLAPHIHMQACVSRFFTRMSHSRKPGFSTTFSNTIGVSLCAESAPMSSIETGFLMWVTMSALVSR